MSSSKYINPLAVFNAEFSDLFCKGTGTESVSAYGEAAALCDDLLHRRLAKHKISTLRRAILESRLEAFCRRFKRSGVRARFEAAANGTPYLVIQSGPVLLVPCRLDDREFKAESLPDHLVHLMRRSIAEARQMSLFDPGYEIENELLCLLAHGAESQKAVRPSFLDVVIPDRHGKIIERMSLLPKPKRRHRPKRKMPKSDIDLPLKDAARRRRDRRKGDSA